jgi:large subunit ribosomal protein L31
MKSEIHPEYVVAHVRCTCGNEFATRATRGEYHLEICSQCHPFYTGRQKLVDTGGRVERFQRRVAKGRLSSASGGRGKRGEGATAEGTTAGSAGRSSAGSERAGATDGGAEEPTGSSSPQQAPSAE